MKTTDEWSSPESTHPTPRAGSGGEVSSERSSDALACTHWWEAVCAPASRPVLIRCFQRVRTWRPPPNWSVIDWLEEVKEVLSVAAVEAETDFNSTRGIPFRAFLYRRVMARVLTRYRQEWNYGTRFLSECTGSCAYEGAEPDALECRSSHSWRTAGEVSSAPEPGTSLEGLAEAVAALSEPSRRLIAILFWEDRTECEAAREFGVSQPAICKRLHTVLDALRRRVNLRK